MDDELINTDWYDTHPQEAVNYIFSQPDFESGFSAFKFFMEQYPDLEIDWVDTFTEFKSLLLNTGRIDEILHFIEWISEKDIDYQYKFEYVEQDLCSYFLLINDLGRLGDRIDFLQKHPIEAFDTLTQPLLFELIYHGHYNLAVSFSQAVWKPVSMSEELIADSEFPFVIALYVNRLQEKYEAWKENGLFDEASFKKYITELGFEVDPPIFNKNLEYLKTALDISRIEESIKNKTSEYLEILNIHFLRYMLEKYNLPFIISERFWSIVNSTILFGEKKKIDRWFFVNANKLKEHVEYRTSFYDTNLLEVFGKVWGLDYIYKFLYDQKLINTADYTIMQANIGAIKKDFIDRADYGLWQMTFIFKWPRVSDLADFEKEEDFLATFGMTEEEVDEEWEVAKSVNFEEDYGFSEDFLEGDEFRDDDELERDYAPQVPFVRVGPKIGRNDPCPCGSGKKYKKCCGS